MKESELNRGPQPSCASSNSGSRGHGAEHEANTVGTGEAAQPHTVKTMVGLEVCKAHLDLLALIMRIPTIAAGDSD